MIQLSSLKRLKNNPRQISDAAIDKLKQSIERDGKFMEARPMIVTSDGVIIGGNQRHRACIELGMKEVPESWVKRVDWTEEEARRFSVVDNAPKGMAGEWDIDLLANEWDIPELEELGFDLAELGLFDGEGSGQDEIDDIYTRKIVAPVYEPKGEKPPIKELIDREKTANLIAEIEQAELPEDIEYFLKMAAERHSVFHFRKIAEFYCHADEQVQDLMEKSGLVIIDFKKAIEYGFVHMTEKLGELADLEESENDEG